MAITIFDANVFYCTNTQIRRTWNPDGFWDAVVDQYYENNTFPVTQPRQKETPQSPCRRRKFGAGRIIEWVRSLQFIPRFSNSTPIPLSWSPVFALPVPQSILEPFKPQKQGKIRRARLCSSSQSLQPY